jgi:phage shock protein A
MAGIFQRMFKIGQAEAHSVVDKLEDPIRMTEQGIRDLKKDLQQAMTAVAQVKATAIRLRKDAGDQKKLAQDYERKAMLLLQKMQAGELQSSDAERLASEALNKKEEAVNREATLQTDYQKQQQVADQLQSKVGSLKQTISRYENELITLKARAKTAASMRKINQQLAKVDTSGTIAMLEKMKNKVQEEESLAEAYGEMATADAGVDAEIDKLLEQPALTTTSDSLADLKKKMGIAG